MRILMEGRKQKKEKKAGEARKEVMVEGRREGRKEGGKEGRKEGKKKKEEGVPVESVKRTTLVIEWKGRKENGWDSGRESQRMECREGSTTDKM
jgi:hypothetical protein